MCWFARARCLKSPFLVSLCVLGAWLHADEVASTSPPAIAAPTEAELCERSLTEVHTEGLNKRLETIKDGFDFDAATIQAMRDAGQIKDKLAERRVLATLRLGTYFLRQGILHEAVFQVFKGHYDSKAQIAEALRSFARLSDVRDKIDLIGEVVERVLQYTPDVDTENLARINATAVFLGMTPDQLQDLRDKFVELDREDEFANVLQGGILAALTSANPDFIAAVQSRAGTWTKLFRRTKPIDVPDRPTALAADTPLRSVQIEDRRYFADDELTAYWVQSSSAARRFFLMSRLGYLTRGQIEFALDHREEWSLKASLVGLLRGEFDWRTILTEKNRARRGLIRDLREADLRLARLENRARYSEIAVQQAIKPLRLMTDQASALALAETILDENVKLASSGQFVNVVTMITGNAPAVLEDGPTLFRLIDGIVTRANQVGLLPDHAEKLQRVLTAASERVSGRDRPAARARIGEVEPTSPRFEALDLDQIKKIRVELITQIATATADLEEAYDRKRGRAPATDAAAIADQR